MSIQELFHSIAERLQATASVRTVYGDAIEAQGRTIIPVARVGYGFGGGAGARQKGKTAERPEGGEGGEGGGGGVGVNPIGVVEISRDETRFILFGQQASWPVP